MALIVVGGHSRSVGKTSVVAGIIAGLCEYQWLAVKITQYGHGICSNHGGPCDCAVDDVEHSFAINEERDRSGESDTSRFVLAGAARSLWVRSRQGYLAEAMPDVRREIAKHDNVIIESNSVMRFLRPDLYLTVLDPNNADFKESARNYLDLADAVLLHEANGSPAWTSVSLKPVTTKPTFAVREGQWVTPELREFIRARLAGVHADKR
jgi:molybdopterin-guanine dinucleotide biosynthesis protein